MSYSPDFLHDVFISYASDDEATGGLISYFADSLRRQLAAQGVRDGVSIFFDRTRLENGKSLTAQILDSARSTAVMVAFHSPPYDNSTDWCHREYREFVQSNPNIEGRFFLIALDGGRLPSQSPVFRGADRHFRSFFTNLGGHFFRFSPQDRQWLNPENFTIDQEIAILAQEISETLTRLRNDSSKKRVFLMASAAFEAQARDLRDSLTGSGFVVTPSSPWLDTETRLSEAAARIGRADLVIGIAENFAASGDSQIATHAQEQAAIVTRLAKPRLQWLPSENHGFSAEEVAALKSQGDVIAGTLEEFKKIVVNRLTGPEAPPTQPPPGIMPIPGAPGQVPTLPFALFISAPDDENGALAALIGRANTMPIAIDGRVEGSLSNDPRAIETWCRQIKESLAQLHHKAVVFVDGNCPRDWIDNRLRNYLVLERDLPNNPKAAVCECPPVPKTELRLFRPRGRFAFLPCDDEAALRTFLLS